MKVLEYKISNWFNRSNPILFVTGIYPGSGKSTLSILLSNVYNTKLLQIDELYTFLRLDKWYPKSAKGLNIVELEKTINTPILNRYYRARSILECIYFFKTRRPDLYEELTKHKFGEEFYLIGKDYWFNKLWPQWTDYLIETNKNSTIPVIIEGGQLNSILIKDWHKDVLLNNSLIAIDRNKYIALFYKAYKKVHEDNKKLKGIKRLYETFKWMINSTKSKHLQDIYSRNETKLNELINIIGKDNIKIEEVRNFLNLSLFSKRMKNWG